MEFNQAKKQLEISKLADLFDRFIGDIIIPSLYSHVEIHEYHELIPKIQDEHPLSKTIFHAAEIIYSRLIEIGDHLSPFQKKLLWIYYYKEEIKDPRNYLHTDESNDIIKRTFGQVFDISNFNQPEYWFDAILSQILSDASNYVSIDILKGTFWEKYFPSVFGYDNQHRTSFELNMDDWESIMHSLYVCLYPMTFWDYQPVKIWSIDEI